MKHSTLNYNLVLVGEQKSSLASVREYVEIGDIAGSLLCGFDTFPVYL